MPDTDTDTRDRLRQAILNVQNEETRLASIEAGLTRARSQLHHSLTALNEASDKLKKATNESRQRLAYNYLTSGDLRNDPVAAIKLVVESAGAEVDQLQDVEAALSEERSRVQSNIRQLRHNLYTAMSEFVCSSPEYLSSVQDHTEAWQNLRTKKAALAAVASGLHGQISQKFFHEQNRSEPLEERVGYSISHEFVEQWASALAQLAVDPDAKLPSP